MNWELDDLISNNSWQDKESFKVAMEMLNELPSDVRNGDDRLTHAGKETTLTQWTDFFITFKMMLEKHMRSWYAQDKLHFAIALSDKAVASLFAASLLDKEIDVAVQIQSPIHRCKIDLVKWKAFLADVQPSNLLQTNHILSRHQEAVKCIAEGASLWDSEDELLVSLRKDPCQLILALKHHQQSGEAAVRDMGICTSTRREDVQASSITANRSLVLSAANNHLRQKFKDENRKTKPNFHRGPDNEARSAQAQKQDNNQENASPKEPRVRPTKEKAAKNMEETLKIFGVTKSHLWADASRRSRSTDLKKAKDLRVQMQKAKREKIIASRQQRLQRGNNVVSVENVDAAIGFFPLKFDGKIRVKSLRFKELKGFVCIQLKKRQIPYQEAEDGSTNLGITALKDLLVSWNVRQHTGPGDPPQDIDVLLEGEEKDFDGVEWTIEKVYDVLAEKNKK